MRPACAPPTLKADGAAGLAVVLAAAIFAADLPRLQVGRRILRRLNAGPRQMDAVIADVEVFAIRSQFHGMKEV